MFSRIESKFRCIRSRMAVLQPSSLLTDWLPTSSHTGLNDSSYPCYPCPTELPLSSQVCLCFCLSPIPPTHVTPVQQNHHSQVSSQVCHYDKRSWRLKESYLGFPASVGRNAVNKLVASREFPRQSQECRNFEFEHMPKNNQGSDFFGEMEQRFLSFKQHKYLKEPEHFQRLARIQSPKFMVIACADSRVCPSSVLGFQPGEAFTIRNVANLVPRLEYGASETSAALEFAVNTLEVKNILVIGHSRCAGIETLMSMQDEGGSSSFVNHWVTNGKVAKLQTKAAASHLSFEQQCQLCEKESINHSLMNLLTYPWIEERVREEVMAIHGGYYDFLHCSFEKWTLDFKGSSSEGGGERYVMKDRTFWS